MTNGGGERSEQRRAARSSAGARERRSGPDSGGRLKPSFRRCSSISRTRRRRDLRALFPVPVDAVRLEIGFGGGEHLLHAARKQSEDRLHRRRAVRERARQGGRPRSRREAIGNIRLFDDDAALLLDWLPPLSLARVDLLFPDPWPKKRHWKRRFVNAANLDRIARVPDGGAGASASRPTSRAMRSGRAMRSREERAARHGGAIAREPWDDWPGTRYEAKAARSGRGAAYLAFRKVG